MPYVAFITPHYATDLADPAGVCCPNGAQVEHLGHGLTRLNDRAVDMLATLGPDDDGYLSAERDITWFEGDPYPLICMDLTSVEALGEITDLETFTAIIQALDMMTYELQAVVARKLANQSQSILAAVANNAVFKLWSLPGTTHQTVAEQLGVSASAINKAISSHREAAGVPSGSA